MKFSDIFAFAKQETSQVFALSAGALYFFWKGGASDLLLICVTALSAVYIGFEKVRAMKQPKPPAG